MDDDDDLIELLSTDDENEVSDAFNDSIEMIESIASEEVVPLVEVTQEIALVEVTQEILPEIIPLKGRKCAQVSYTKLNDPFRRKFGK